MVSAALNKAAVLVEALPYMQRFYGQTFVIKYGGSVMKEKAAGAALMLDIVLLKHIGINPVLVHGGGPEINAMLTKLALESEFKNGLRVTDPATMQVVQMVLSGQVNKDIVNLLNDCGGRAIGLTGLDGPLIEVKPAAPELGRVGQVKKVNSDPLIMLSQKGYIPVVASIGRGPHGESYNINADLVAGELAAALGAAKLILLTDVEGIFAEQEGVRRLVSQLTPSSGQKLLESGQVAGGMIPKLTACIQAVEAGVGRAHIIDGRVAHSLLLEIFTDTGIGTMVAEECNRGEEKEDVNVDADL